MILTKYIAVITAVGGFIAGGAAMKYAQPKIEFPPPTVCPACNCPPQANGIDFEKVKNFKGTLRIDQHYSVSSDSSMNKIMEEAVRNAVRTELEKLKVVKCR